MTTATAVFLLLGWAGGALALEQLAWFRARPLRHRLEPYLTDSASSGPRSATPLRTALTSQIDAAADRLGRALGGRPSLDERLRQAGLDVPASAHRAWRTTTAALVGTTATGAALALEPGWPAADAGVGLLVIAVVVGDEVRLRGLRRARTRQLSAELPVVAEQLGMLLSAGFSLPAALQRLAARGNGVVADGLTEVVRRVRQGESELTALEEWADGSGADGAVRLVRVLSLHRQAGDLGVLISEEARSVRAEHHRRLLESISRREQLVWIPVTVATLVPGLIVLAVPFASAVGQITGG